MALYDFTPEQYAQAVTALAKEFNVSEARLVELWGQWGVTPEKYGDIVQRGADFGVRVIKDKNGNIYAAKSLPDTIDISDEFNAAIGNSNIKSGTTRSAEYVVDQSITSDGTISSSLGVKSSSTGAKIPAVFKSVGQGIAAAATGITLGRAIDQALYDANPGFWDSIGWSSLNPETWGDITAGDSSLGATLFNFVFGIKPDTKETQAYMDENALAYMALVMQQQDFFKDATGGQIKDDDISGWGFNMSAFGGVTTPVPYVESNTITFTESSTGSGYSKHVYTVPNGVKTVYYKNFAGWTKCGFFSKESFSATRTSYLTSGSVGQVKTANSKSATANNQTIHFIDASADLSDNYSTIYPVPYAPVCVNSTLPSLNKSPLSTNVTRYIGVSILYGDISTSSAYPGVYWQNEASKPSLSSATTVDEALALLKEQYPELWSNMVTNTLVQEDGSLRTINYVPVSMPQGSTALSPDPTMGSSTQADPAANQETSTKEMLDFITKLITSGPTTTDTGTGDAPSNPLPTGSASSLWAVYNPTQSEVDSFGSWLWSSDLVDQIKKLFSDPMQGIIGLHKVFASPPVSGKANIKVGYVDSNVPANKVSAQYTTVDCGTVQLNEQYRNVFDYYPYTEISIYLPFVGIVRLDPSDVMRGAVSVKYHVDVITGAGLAEVSVKRDNAGGVLYTYPCNCAVTYPVSSGSYLSAIASGITSGLSMARFGAVGAIAGAVGGAVLHGADVSHSGQFHGNNGAMGIKKPYIIVSRPQIMMPNGYKAFQGNPTNYETLLSLCKGYTVVESVHVSVPKATGVELSEIERLLKEGVIIK